MLVNRYTYKKIERVDSPEGRVYVSPSGEKLPSITTILSKTKSEKDKLVLENWRKRVGHVNAKQITNEAAGRGTRMHKYIEDYIRTGIHKEAGSNPFSKQSHKMAELIIENAFRNVNEIWGFEVSLYYPGLYAGTTDCVGVWNNKSAIMDYKQSNKVKKPEWIEDYFIQLAAYSEAHNKLYGTDIKTGVILMCTANYQYQQFLIEGKEFDNYVNKWYDRVEEYYNLR